MPPEPPSAKEILERERATWSAASAGWRANDEIIVGFTRDVSEEMIRRAEIRKGMRVLDLASGTGEPSISIAERVAPGGSVLGIDLAEPMLEFAREKAAGRNVRNIEFRVSDVESAALPPSTFDAATMRFGLMFVPDPVAALRHVHAALRPGAKVAVAVWGPPPDNPFLRLPLDVLQRHLEVPKPPPGSPGLFSFGDRYRLPSVMKSAGFASPETSEVRVRVSAFRTGEEYWKFTRSVAGPITKLYESLTPPVRSQVDSEIAAEAENYATGAGLSLPGLSWVGWGSR